MKKKVALFFGGRSLESDISVITALQALSALDSREYEAEPVFMTDGKMFVDGVDKLSAFKNFDESQHRQAHLIQGGLYELRRGKLKRKFSPDVALICCHGGEGEGGILQAMLEYNGIKYTSCSPLASALLLDKTACKRAFENMLLGVLPHSEALRSDFETAREDALDALEQLKYPMIVKPSRLGSSIGISAAHNREELAEALEIAFKFDCRADVEHMLTDCVEVNCAAMRDGDKILVSETERPLTSNAFLTFEDKYLAGGKMSEGGHMIPAGLGATELLVKAITESVYRELDLDGVIRADYLVDATGKIFINEINTVPGSLAFYLFKDMSQREFLSKLIENASLKRYEPPKKFKTEILSRVSGSKMIK